MSDIVTLHLLSVSVSLVLEVSHNIEINHNTFLFRMLLKWGTVLFLTYFWMKNYFWTDFFLNNKLLFNNLTSVFMVDDDVSETKMKMYDIKRINQVF